MLCSLLWISFILYREGHWVACCHTSLGSATLQLLQLLRLQLSLQSVMALAEGCVPISICILDPAPAISLVLRDLDPEPC